MRFEQHTVRLAALTVDERLVHLGPRQALKL